MADPNKLKHIRSCTRHPTHRQSPGVCSLCVNEKLARLTSSTSKLSPCRLSRYYLVSSSSSLSDDDHVSSCSSSECLSPREVRAKYANPRGSVSFVKRREEEGDDVVLSKSKSMAAAFVRRVRSGSEKVKIRSGGFWSKVLKRTNRK